MIRTIVVDDEQPSLDRLEKLINGSGLAAVNGKFLEPLSALEFLKANKVDAVFLDIEMPDMDGIELAARILDLQNNVAVVFVTAYNQYAVEAFRINALDYLMKPVSLERLMETLQRTIARDGFVAPAGGLRVRCFGRFSACAGGEIKFRTEKAEELLAYFIDRKGGFVSRSKILDCLWADFEGDRAMVHFNTTLYYMKRALLHYGIHIPIHYDRGAYRMEMDGIDCDYLKFILFAEKEAAVTQDNLRLQEEAAGLYLGEYLSGWEYDWAVGKRLILETQYIQLVLRIAEYYKKLGNYQRAAQWLETGLLHEPLHRELNYRLVEVLLMSHERTMAAKYYGLYRNGLMKRLKTEPDDALKKLFE